MAEKPILFNAKMVRAILDGRKTQTRRVIKPQPENTSQHSWEWMEVPDDDGEYSWMLYSPIVGNGGVWKCPYGNPGDTLWVRETWATDLHFEQDAPSTIAAKAEDAGYYPPLPEHPPCPLWYKADGGYRRWGDFDTAQGGWRPSIHMPRWASRIDLTVKAVRVERVQEIIPTLWDSINKKRGFGWDSNPWVWVVEFEKIGE